MVRATLRASAFLVAAGMVGIAFGQAKDGAASGPDTVPESCPSVVQFTIGRPPVPDEAAEKQARNVAWQLYGADYTAAKTAASKSALAERLLGESDDARGDPASRYAMLRIVIDMAGASGDAETSLAAADRLIDEFDVEILQEKLAVLRALASSARQMEQHLALAKAAFVLLDVAFMEENFEIAQVSPGEQLRALEGHAGRVRSVAFAADGRRVLSCGDDRTVRLWDPHTGELLKTLTPHAAMVTNLVLSSDGSKMATCSPDKTIKIWDVAGLRMQKVLRGDGRWPWKVAFSPDGRFLATTFGEGKASLWDVESGERRWVISRPEGEPSQAVAFSPDGRWILVAGRATYYIFDSIRGRELARFQAHPDVARCAQFSPDGRTLATSGDDGLIKLWDVATWAPK